MEVNRVERASLDKVKSKNNTTSEKISFSEVMQQKKDQLHMEKFHRLITDIEDQGKVLAQSQTVEDLREYKKLIKELVDDTIKYGLSLEERRGFNRRGRSKVYKIVEEVDKKVLELTNAVLDKQKTGLELLDMVGEIKGLLINIYT
jgi:uncharacterized protein YaaR (DUF327 family)